MTSGWGARPLASVFAAIGLLPARVVAGRARLLISLYFIQIISIAYVNRKPISISDCIDGFSAGLAIECQLSAKPGA